jgi:hypothetical protein
LGSIGGRTAAPGLAVSGPITLPERADNEGRFASAEACFERMHPALAAVSAEKLKPPNLDLQQAAIVALRIDERLRQPSDRARIEAMVIRYFAVVCSASERDSALPPRRAGSTRAPPRGHGASRRLDDRIPLLTGQGYGRGSMALLRQRLLLAA